MAKQFKSWMDFMNFSESVKRRARFVFDEDVTRFLDALFETSNSRHHVISKNKYVWRAQLGNSTVVVEEKSGDSEESSYCYEDLIPYPADRMKPKRESAREGRVNPKGIPCLYVANKLETAISETRPWIGSLVSVGQFRITRNLKLIDFSVGHDRELDILSCLDDPSPTDIESFVWTQVDKAFSRPVNNSDDTAEYIPTQVISEFFKTRGFDGVAYRSLFGDKGYNLALFDLDAAELVNCALCPVESIKISHGKMTNSYRAKTEEPAL